jgi:hypothetical protein
MLCHIQQTPKFYFFLTICVFIHESSLNTVHPTALNRLIQSIELRGLYIVVKRVFTSTVYIEKKIIHGSHNLYPVLTWVTLFS